ncbi:hypothetical protein GYMLUDRAFT_246934 [Collybiopsis luxurians FD-317 M1]|uniref:Unplaced genomic scaffold GYMLUscaffold_42, whole genome shotgun sequence n=1 Tax=Collybiopsis luxurians FD-317 M1 TaxID=944289 RepID=A0A0D0CQB1_9AGAR|nr:hypothetical protein GYMLUDRAFT_246934 [Collybiopsis luxurians FD-317 M1]
MAVPNHARYYASKQYLLPADELETTRAFDNKLSLAPLDLQTGDRVLESAAGTGVWALEFSEQNKQNGVTPDIECIDICDKQYPATHPTNIHFSLHSVVDLPTEWAGTFSYAHQRLLILAMNDSLWRKAIGELFRVLSPGGWVELIEHDAKHTSYGVGPYSNKLVSLLYVMYAEKEVVGDLGVYLPKLCEEVGFVDIRCEARRVSIGRSGENGYPSGEWRDVWKGMKQPLMNAGGCSLVRTEEEYEELLEGATREWDDSNEAGTTFYTILARKP